MHSGEESTPDDKTIIIDKIIGEMKSEFNKDEAPSDFKKPEERSKENGAKGAKRQKVEESMMLKRSARRRSKECGESILQSAIARKEKSYNEGSKPQRLTRQLKPTQKILENLALAKQEKSRKVRLGDSDDEEYVRSSKRGKHRQKFKKIKTDSDSDQEYKNGKEESEVRRSRRISTSKVREDSNEEPNDENEKNCKEIETKKEGLACLCEQKTKYFLAANNEEFVYCGAVDTLGDKNIGCGRTVLTKDLMLMRPSQRIPYTIYCEAHKNRLLRHNCCANCGIFCTQGRFLECESKHYYHQDCQISIGKISCCPHCGAPTTSHDVDLTLQTAKKPIFLPTQKKQCVNAKMAFSSNTKNEEIKPSSPPLLPIGSLDMQNTLQYGDEEFELADLISAIQLSSIEKVALILGSKSVDITLKIPEFNDGTVLHLSAQKGNVSIAHMLLVAGAQSDSFDKEQNTPLMLAISAKNNEIVQYLIKTGSSVNVKGTDGMTSLHLAAKCGNLRACELLLKASTGLRNFVNGQDDGGWTPLVWACEHGYADVANFLIYKGADASIRDVEHNVALHWAAFSGNAHITELLLNKGCDVNAANAHGDTPLHIGARQDMYDCNIVLLARGADVTSLNKNSESPLDCVPPGGDSYSPIALNITLQASVDFNSSNVILSNDISKGKETNPIQCYNNIDNDPLPLDFQYVTRNCVTLDGVKVNTRIDSLECCKCDERCVDHNCHCGELSVRCWYDEEGKLISDFNYSDAPMLFECNDRCECNIITCNNRVVQKGLTQRFELFKTDDKGWGVRSLRQIPKGSFVCEYVGEIISDMEAEKREDDSFLFDLENRVCRTTNDDTYCIDAKFYGNFARFINHSCNPNLTSVKVFIEHQDLRFPRVAFFAHRDIQASEELSFDYGEKFWMTKYRSLTCLCGSAQCKYSEDTITMTMSQRKEC